MALDTILEEAESKFVDPEKAIASFRRIRDFFPRDDYVYDSIVRLVKQKGETVACYSVYKSLSGRRRNIEKSIQDAVFELEEEVKSKRIHDINILPVSRKEAKESIGKIGEKAKKLRDVYSFTFYKAMARHLHEQVNTKDMPIKLEFVLELLKGFVPVVPSTAAYRVYLEIDKMLENARNGKPDEVNLVYLVKNKKYGGPSEPLDVLIARALRKFIGGEFPDEKEIVYKALNGFREVGQLDELVRKVSGLYGFPDIKTTYKCLVDFADIKWRARRHVKTPESVSRKLYALALILDRAKTKYKVSNVDPIYLVGGADEYTKLIDTFRSDGFNGELLVSLLSRSLRINKETIRNMYVTGERQKIRATHYLALQELAKRLRDVSVIDLSDSRKEQDEYGTFKHRYARGPVIVNLGGREELDSRILQNIGADTNYYFEKPYSFPRLVKKSEAGGYQYLPFSEFLKFIDLGKR